MTSPFRGSASGRTRQQLRGKRYERLGRDVYVLRPDGDAQALRTRVLGLRLVLPDAVPCTVTAALLLNLPVDDDGLVHLARPPGSGRSERSDVITHRFALADHELHDVQGLPVTSGPRTFADLSSELPLEALVALGDVVLRRWGMAAIEDAVIGHGRRRGAVLLKAALPLLDAGADSPPESRGRLRLHAAGFTGLQHKVVVRDVGGGWLGEPDLADPVAKVALQHEGAVHFAKGERQRRRDLDRDEVVREQGWQVVSSTALDDRDPERLIRKVTAAYLRAAKLWGPQVLPPHLR